MKLLAIDFLSISLEKRNQHVRVVTDNLTKYSWAFPTRNQQVSTGVTLLWKKILGDFGFPQRLHSDQGRDFESRITKDLFVQGGRYRETRRTPYHPQGNGQIERFNRTLLGMFGTFDNDQKGDWSEHVAPTSDPSDSSQGNNFQKNQETSCTTPHRHHR